MFSMRSPQHLNQRAALERMYTNALSDKYPKYKMFIEKSVNKMLSNFDELKTTLEKSVKDYLSEIQNKFFHTAEKKQGGKLQKNISEAKCFTDLILSVKEATKEDNDSIKNFLYKIINSNFGDNNAIKFHDHPLHLNCNQFLKDILEKAEEQLVSECISNTSNLSDNLSKLIRSYL